MRFGENKGLGVSFLVAVLCGFATSEAYAGAGSTMSGTKTVTGTFEVGGTVTYTVVLTNNGAGTQADNPATGFPGNEFGDVLPPSLALVSAAATSGTATADSALNLVTWNGAVAPNGTVTITIVATILRRASASTVSNQGSIFYDADGNGSNESTEFTDDPAVSGVRNPTNFGVPWEVPTAGPSSLSLLAVVLACLGIGMLRARSALGG